MITSHLILVRYGDVVGRAHESHRLAVVDLPPSELMELQKVAITGTLKRYV